MLLLAREIGLMPRREVLRMARAGARVPNCGFLAVNRRRVLAGVWSPSAGGCRGTDWCPSGGRGVIAPWGRPRVVRLGSKFRANMFEVVLMSTAGKRFVQRTYVWGTRWKKKKTRVVILRVSASGPIDDPELDFVLASLGERK